MRILLKNMILAILITALNGVCFAQSTIQDEHPLNLSGSCQTMDGRDRFDILGKDPYKNYGVFMDTGLDAEKIYGIRVYGQYGVIVRGPGVHFRFKSEVKKGTILDFSFLTQRTDTKPELDWICRVKINEDFF